MVGRRRKQHGSTDTTSSAAPDCNINWMVVDLPEKGGIRLKTFWEMPLNEALMLVTMLAKCYGVEFGCLTLA